jgi:general secretion pathway protein G
MTKPNSSNEGSHGAAPGKQPNVWIIIVMVVAVMAVVSVCMCGGVGVLMFPAYRVVQENATIEIAETRVEMLETALEVYRLDTGGYPTTEQGLTALRERPSDLADPAKWSGPYLPQSVPLDPWDREFQYELLGPDRFRVWSIGPDGVSGSEDDIVNYMGSNQPPEAGTY